MAKLKKQREVLARPEIWISVGASYMIKLIPYQQSKVLAASSGDAILIAFPFHGGYKSVLMFSFRRKCDGHCWSPSVMIPLTLGKSFCNATTVSELCEDLMNVAKGEKNEAVCHGQIKRGPAKKVHMFLHIVGGEKISIRIGGTSWRSPKKKSTRDLPYNILLSPRDTIKLAKKIMRLREVKAMKLPRPFRHYKVKEEILSQLLKTKDAQTRRQEERRSKMIERALDLASKLRALG